MEKVFCNMCGNEIDKMDLMCNKFSIDQNIGYGSIYDNNTLTLNLCSDCQDGVITYLIRKCKINPIRESFI